MAVFMIVIAKVKDRARFLDQYGKPAAALMAQFGGRYVVRAPGAFALESALGGAGEGCSIVVSQWPDRTTLEAFWNSAEYAALKAARLPLADVDVLVVEQPGG